jgi:hypothetical protein
MAEWQPIETALFGVRVLVMDSQHGRLCAVRDARDGWVSVPGRYSLSPLRWIHLPDPFVELSGAEK